MRFPAGKLPPAMLAGLLASLRQDSTVVVGPRVGEDACVLDLGADQLLVVKTDPITFAAEDIGRYLLAVNSNDLAAMGAEPRWLLVTALLPEAIEDSEVEIIFDGLRSACDEARVALAGGHTEITAGIDRPILVGCLLGTVARGGITRTSDARTGDAIVLAGALAIEGTAILAREHGVLLRALGVDPSTIARAADFLRDPGISVLPAARALNATGRVHAMHDPTEGGLATALHELAEASGNGVRIRADAIPILPETRAICHAAGLDPLGLLASGALLATLEASDAPAALERLRGAGIPAALIGEVVELQAGRKLGDAPLPVFARDEIARFLETE